MNTLHSEIRLYESARALDSFLHRSRRRKIVRLLGACLFLLGLIIFGHIVYDSVRTMGIDIRSITTSAKYFTGTFLVLLPLYAILVQLSYFYNTLYYRGFDAILQEDFTDSEGLTFEVASICARGGNDLTRSFLTSSYGEEVILRLGIRSTEIAAFLASERILIPSSAIEFKPHVFLTLQDLSEFILVRDTTFLSFLSKHGIPENVFRSAYAWISRIRMAHKNKRRWWSRDNLGTIPGIGREFSLGIAYELEEYMQHITNTSSFGAPLHNIAYANEILTKIEIILTRNKAANVIMVGEPGVGKMEMLIELDRKMNAHTSVESLFGKRLVVFDAQTFVATHNSKESFEYAFLKLMGGAERAGNIIIVIENFASFLKSVHALNVDAETLVGRFLTSTEVQIIATSDTGNFHTSLERQHELLQYFEPILIEAPDLMSTVHVLEDAIWPLEYEHRIFFTYPALLRIAESADQYIVDGVMPDKALSLLSEVASEGSAAQVGVIQKSFVDTCITKKTGIKTGPILDQERELLLNLESILHKRVVGQDAAIQAISGAMRRSRAGIQSKEKPIGSFLFLGPTGVGKTETAKALAHTFFGDEKAMIRFDMSEFSDERALSRLIGTKNNPGALASALREHPYALLLLDEFEKATSTVHDLFLQILDEGRFTDALGTQVNARNTIIVATSNAGSDVIRGLKSARTKKSTGVVVDTIIANHIFKPELINRFDAVILFESITPDDQRAIAKLMLQELAERITERGYELVIDDVLINILMQKGYNPEFGARPMRREIQDSIEEKIALKIIEGGLQPGDSIHFTENDFQDVESDPIVFSRSTH